MSKQNRANHLSKQPAKLKALSRTPRPNACDRENYYRSRRLAAVNLTLSRTAKPMADDAAVEPGSIVVFEIPGRAVIPAKLVPELFQELRAVLRLNPFEIVDLLDELDTLGCISVSRAATVGSLDGELADQFA